MKQKYEAPKFHFYGSASELMFGFTGVNKEWDYFGNTKPCAGCLS